MASGRCSRSRGHRGRAAGPACLVGGGAEPQRAPPGRARRAEASTSFRPGCTARRRHSGRGRACRHVACGTPPALAGQGGDRGLAAACLQPCRPVRRVAGRSRAPRARGGVCLPGIACGRRCGCGHHPVDGAGIARVGYPAAPAAQGRRAGRLRSSPVHRRADSGRRSGPRRWPRRTAAFRSSSWSCAMTPRRGSGGPRRCSRSSATVWARLCPRAASCAKGSCSRSRLARLRQRSAGPVSGRAAAEPGSPSQPRSGELN